MNTMNTLINTFRSKYNFEDRQSHLNASRIIHAIFTKLLRVSLIIHILSDLNKHAYRCIFVFSAVAL